MKNLGVALLGMSFFLMVFLLVFCPDPLDSELDVPRPEEEMTLPTGPPLYQEVEAAGTVTKQSHIVQDRPQRIALEDSLQKENKQLKVKLVAAQKRIKELERRILKAEAKKTAESFAREFELTEDELLSTLDNSELLPGLIELHQAVKASTPRNVWNALQLENKYIKELIRISEQCPDSASFEVRMNHQKTVIGPWVNYNLESLCARLRTLRIPDPLVEHFRRVRKEDQ